MLMYLSIIESEDDKTKFEIIYNEYKNRMYYEANKIVNNSMDAEDIVHQSFLKVIKILDQIEVPKCPKTKNTIVLIVERTSIDFLRKKKRRVILPLDDEKINIPTISEIENIPDASVVSQAMALLPTKYRELLLLKFDSGFSEHEIGEMFSMTDANVKKTIQRAKAKLKSILEELGEEV